MNISLSEVPRPDRRSSVLIHPPAPPVHPPSDSYPPAINILKSTPTDPTNPSNPSTPPVPRSPIHSNSVSQSTVDQLEALAPIPSSNTTGSQINLTRTNTTAFNNNSVSHTNQPGYHRTHSSNNPYIPGYLTQSATTQSELSSNYSHSLQTNTTSRVRPNSNFNNNRNSSTSVLDQRFNDRFPSTKPSQDYQDLLWTQIDILDDVKRMSEQATQAFKDSLQEEEKSTNVGGEEEQEEMPSDSDQDPRVSYLRKMRQLRESQIQVIEQMKKTASELSSNTDHLKIWNDANIMNEYRSNREQGKTVLYNREYFHKISHSLKDVEKNMEGVSGALRKVSEAKK